MFDREIVMDSLQKIRIAIEPVLTEEQEDSMLYREVNKNLQFD